MGIQGLLPLLKPIHNHTHVSEFSGKTLAVDAYVWLHKGAYGCAPDLVTGKPTVKYVDYAMHRVRMLRHFGIQPYLVFDGGPLPAKKGTEQERQKRRDENFARASELAKAGKHSQARDYYVKCVDVTPQMAYQLIKALRVEAVPYVVAPYEADAQLTYLERSGIVDGIITEDSDLLVFGARTVLFKFDISGSVVTISRAHFGNIHSGTFSLVGWTDTEFREMAMLSGCDYLASIPGIGLITAWKLLRKYKTVEKVLQFIRLEGAKKIPPSYLDSFRMAELAFKHQRVYCPRSRCLVYLTDIPDGHEWDSTKEAYIGLDIDPHTAIKLSEGDIDPITMEPMTDINPKYMPVAHKSFLKRPFGHALEDDQETLESPKKSAKEKPAKGSLFDFFARKSKPCATPTPQMKAGRCSGARTLSTVNERSQIRGEQHQVEAVAANRQSRFFASPRSAKTTPKGKRRREASNTPVKNKRPRDLSDQENEPETVVEQEEGYLSPSPLSRRSWSNSSPLSSPGKEATPKVTDFTEFDVDPISSPVQRVELSNTSFIPPPRFSLDCIVGGVGNIQPRELHNHSVAFDAKAGPDLNDIFDDIRGSDEDLGDISVDSKGPITPESNPTPELSVRDPWDDLDDLEPEQSRETVQKRISDGWWNRYSLVSAETTRLTTAETPGSLFQNRTIRSTPTLATSTPSIRKKTKLPTAPTTLKVKILTGQSDRMVKKTISHPPTPSFHSDRARSKLEGFRFNQTRASQ